MPDVQATYIYRPDRCRPKRSPAAARSPEQRLLHHQLDTWTGLGLVVVGLERHGLRFSLGHIGEDEWRAQFSAHPMFAPAGFGVAATPWEAVQRAAASALRHHAA